MKLHEDLSTAETAAQLLPAQVARFFKTGRKAFASGSIDDLHRFRIAAKQFRYSLEVFAPVYGAKLNARLASLKELQDLMGKFNDLATAHELVKKEKHSAEAAAWLRRRETKVRRALASYWQETMDAPGEEEAWRRYFVQIASRTHKRSTVIS